MVVGPLAWLVSRLAKGIAGGGAGNPPNHPKQSTLSSVSREPVGFKVSIQQSLLIGTGGIMKMSRMPEDLHNLEVALWLIFKTMKALFFFSYFEAIQVFTHIMALKNKINA